MRTSAKPARRRPGRPATHGARQFARQYLDGADGRLGKTKLVRIIACDVANDLGGLAVISTAQRILTERIAFKTVLLETIEAYVMRQGTPFKGEELLPVLGRYYLAHANSLRLDLVALGLNPAVDRTPSLAEYLAAKRARAVETNDRSAIQPAASNGADHAADAESGSGNGVNHTDGIEVLNQRHDAGRPA